jgi:hypothetical protein
MFEAEWCQLEELHNKCVTYSKWEVRSEVLKIKSSARADPEAAMECELQKSTLSWTAKRLTESTRSRSSDGVGGGGVEGRCFEGRIGEARTRNTKRETTCVSSGPEGRRNAEKCRQILEG